jgi:hypothetical protein
LVFLNDKNVLQPPIALTIDRIKSELSALRRHHHSIRLGICRLNDRSLLNDATVQHLGALKFDEFQQISLEEQSTPLLNDNRKLLSNNDKHRMPTESKRLSHFFSSKKRLIHEQTMKSSSSSSKRSTSPNRDSGFIETDGKYLMIYSRDCRRIDRKHIDILFRYEYIDVD